MPSYDSGMSALPCVVGCDSEAVVDALAQALEAHGACVIDDFPDRPLTAALRHDLQRLQADAALSAAAVGRGELRRQRPRIRGDATLWLDDPRCGLAASRFLTGMDGLRTALNRRLYLGLDEVEAHYAAYPPGVGYARHRDRFATGNLQRDRCRNARVLSLVSYLNHDWRGDEGGALRLYLPAGAVDVVPSGGRSICFLSEIEHEVLPATRERLSVAGWMRTRTDHR